MSLLQETKQLCTLYHVKPVHARGQNFLINEEVYQKIVAAAELSKKDKVVEVGPGLGFLTALLAEESKEVTAVELDRRLAEVARERMLAQGFKNVTVLQMDILTWLKSKRAPHSAYKIVANLPYNISAIFLREFLSAETPPQLLVLMLQKEVAERLTAQAGEMSLLALSVQFYARAEFLFAVPRTDFWPSPAVDSAVVRLTVGQPGLNREETKLFFRLARLGFAAKRKMLKNNLASGLRLDMAVIEKYLLEAGLPAKARAQDLSLADWLKLFSLIKEKLLK